MNAILLIFANAKPEIHDWKIYAFWFLSFLLQVLRRYKYRSPYVELYLIPRNLMVLYPMSSDRRRAVRLAKEAQNEIH